ncbi:major facilitator superfamily multidrug-resistance, DHA1 sub-family [Mycena floridula]|nr:major facilitator superfamily multidrug-resistance, DHA1 sub-family [Mycena floridula]
MSSESLPTSAESLPLKKRTPLPKIQLFVVFLVQFAEPITAVVIYPFAPQFVRRTGITGGDDAKIGYYAGIIESSFFIAECLSVYQWSRASDHYGRRTVLLIGPLGLTIAMLGFGLSKTFWSMLFFRFSQGIFNGNIGVGKTMIAEITDSTNIGQAFGYLPIIWCFGDTIGPLIGGLLSNPATKWPRLFGRTSLWRENPYFLPCATAGLFAFVAFVTSLFFLEETLLSRKRRSESTDHTSESLDPNPSYGSTSTSDPPKISEEAAPSFRTLVFEPRIFITLTCYAFLAFNDMAYASLVPLMYSTSIPLGGLGLKPSHIGTIMACTGIAGVMAQILILSRLMQRYGPRKMFIASLASSFIAFGAFPLMSFMAKRAGKVDAGVILVIGVQLSCSLMVYVAYASMQVLLVDSAPSKAALAGTNSLGQIVACCLRSFAPSIASSLFSVSLQYNLLQGYFVYAVILANVLIGMRVALRLPGKMRMDD